MPTDLFAECARDQWSSNYPTIDKQVVNLERVGPPVIAGCVEPPDLAGQVSLKTTNAGEQTKQREQESHIESHQEMSGRHEQCSDGDGASASEKAVGNQTPG